MKGSFSGFFALRANSRGWSGNRGVSVAGLICCSLGVAQELSRQLDESHDALHTRWASEIDLLDLWQARLQRLLREHPDLARQVGAPLHAHSAAHVESGSVNMPAVFGNDHQVVGHDDQSVRIGGVGRDDYSIKLSGKGHHIGNRITVRKFALGGAVAAVALVLLATVVWPRVAPLLTPAEQAPAMLLDLQPASGARGDRVQVEAHGFEPGERVKV